MQKQKRVKIGSLCTESSAFDHHVHGYHSASYSMHHLYALDPSHTTPALQLMKTKGLKLDHVEPHLQNTARMQHNVGSAVPSTLPPPQAVGDAARQPVTSAVLAFKVQYVLWLCHAYASSSWGGGARMPCGIPLHPASMAVPAACAHSQICLYAHPDMSL